MKIHLSTLLLLLCFSIGLNAQTIRSSFIDSIVERSMSTMPQAGVAVAVVQNGKIVHSKGYGVRSIESKEPVNEKTLFSIASNSKAFTTAALGILVDEGKLKWNDRVVDHVPEFKMYDSYVTENFTITDLITHRSGLGLGAGDLMFIPHGSDFKVEDVVRSFQYQEPTSDFRTKYDYDNLLYIVAGEVIKRVSGTPWDRFVEERIMRPLGMQNSAGYFQNLESTENIALPHNSEGGKLVLLETYTDPHKVFGAAGGIYASVDELCQWMLLHLNNGKYGDSLEHVLLEPATHREMWKLHTNISFNAEPTGSYKTHYKSYGLGWFLSDDLGYTTVSHTGGMPGMLSQTFLIPELDAGIVVLTNAAPGGYSFITVVNEIEDALINAPDRDWVGDAKGWIEGSESHAEEIVDAVWDVVEKSDKKSVKNESFVGTYADDWFGEVVIEERGDKLWFSSKRSPLLNGEMCYYRANSFAIKWEYQLMNCDAFAIFSLDENELAQRIEMKGISPNIDFSFDFHDLDLRRVNIEK